MTIYRTPPPPTTGTEQKSQNVYLITGNWYRYLINDRSRSRFLTTFIWCGGIPRRDRRNASRCPSSRLSIRTKNQNNATTTFKKHFYLAFTWDSGGLLSWPVIMMGLLENEEIIFFAPEAYCTQCTVYRGPVSPLLGFYNICSYNIHVQALNGHHPSVNRGPRCLTSVFLWELVFPTWFSRSTNN